MLLRVMFYIVRWKVKVGGVYTCICTYIYIYIYTYIYGILPKLDCFFLLALFKLRFDAFDKPFLHM